MAILLAQLVIDTPVLWLHTRCDSFEIEFYHQAFLTKIPEFPSIGLVLDELVPGLTG